MLRAARFLALCLCAACATPQKAGPDPDEERETEQQGEGEGEAEAEAPEFHWALPDGWRPETIHFPMEFAPELAYQGVEELRFPPGMFKQAAPTYFSYAFVWWLSGEPSLTEADLESTLNKYFLGLMREVGKKKKYKFEPGGFNVELSPQSGAPAKEGHNVLAYGGKARLHDAFTTGQELLLNVEVWVWECPVANRRVALFLTSPQSRSAPVWASLEQRRDEFLCHKY